MAVEDGRAVLAGRVRAEPADGIGDPLLIVLARPPWVIGAEHALRYGFLATAPSSGIPPG
jgi:hypothetical protein